jgi:hypothetical protein
MLSDKPLTCEQNYSIFYVYVNTLHIELFLYHNNDKKNNYLVNIINIKKINFLS